MTSPNPGVKAALTLVGRTVGDPVYALMQASEGEYRARFVDPTASSSSRWTSPPTSWVSGMAPFVTVVPVPLVVVLATTVITLPDTQVELVGREDPAARAERLGQRDVGIGRIGEAAGDLVPVG